MSDDNLSRNYSECDSVPSTSGVSTGHNSSPEIFDGSINRLDSTNDQIQEITRRSVTPSKTTEASGSNKRKTSKSDLNSSGIKDSKQSLDNVDAAIFNEENVLKSIEKSPVKLKSSLLKDLYLSGTVKIVSKDAVGAACKKKGKKSRDENNSIRKNNQQVSSRIINDGSSSSRMENDVEIDIEKLNITSPNSVKSSPETKNTVNINSNSLLSSGPHCDISPKKSNDTASITFPSIFETCDPAYKYIVSDRKTQDFIRNLRMMEPDDIVPAFDPTEIEEIISDVIILGTQFYLVKWKKWSKGFNTWERLGSLYNAQRLVLKYAKNKKTNGHVNNYKQVNGIELMLSRKNVSLIFELFRTETGLSLPILLPESIINLFNSLDVGSIQSQKIKLNVLQKSLATIALGNIRQRQLIKLQGWEFDINVFSRDYQIKVENNMDLEGPPDAFVYVRTYVPQANIIIPDDPPIGCSCRQNCLLSEECCYAMAGCLKAYDKNKNIVVTPDHPVFECNKKCICTNSCTNRVVQLGSRVNICIYKTRKYGWGVKSSQNIQQGQFVGKYIGEIITVKESEQRFKRGSSLLDNMWNLDFYDSQNYKYIIDGTHYANFTYFINHSCEANLNVYAVWINCLDRNLPELALFANRDISAGEQLTTDYFSRSNPDTLKKSGTKCQCQMKNCQGYYF